MEGMVEAVSPMLPAGLRNRNATKKKRFSMPMNSLASTVDRNSAVTTSVFADSNLGGGKIVERIRRQSDVSTYMHPGSNTFFKEEEDDAENNYEFPCGHAKNKPSDY